MGCAIQTRYAEGVQRAETAIDISQEWKTSFDGFVLCFGGFGVEEVAEGREGGVEGWNSTGCHPVSGYVGV